MRRQLLIVDAGPHFAGWAGTSDGRTVCVAPREIETDSEARLFMREIVKRGGGDCDGCRGCPAGGNA